MSCPSPFAVLIDIADGALADRVRRALDAANFTTATSGEPAPEIRLDVVVSSRADALAQLGLAATGTTDVGMVLVGNDDPAADVCLPADFTDRELMLACRLVAQVVEWRRKALRTAETGRELARLAHIDALTQVPNRRAWDLELAPRLQAATDAGQAVALAIFDVDHFKVVNDEAGHAVGDAVLTAVGRGLADSLRTTDFVARLGGDEFGLLLVGSFDAGSAVHIVERVRNQAIESVAAVSGRGVTVSAGCVMVDRGAIGDPAELFAAADAALRHAKQAGRNRTQK